MHELTYGDVKAAADRIAGRVRPVVVAPLDPGTVEAAVVDPLDDRTPDDCQVYLALELMQHTGSFKARGAINFLAAHLEAGTLPEAGVTIASGGNAGLACAWAARQHGVPATVFVPRTAPAVKVAKLRAYGARVEQVGTEYAHALTACQEFSRTTGALASHAYDHPLIAAGAGTILEEIRAQIPGLDTVVVAVGGGGLFAGVATAAQHHSLRTVAVEPENCRALNAAIEAGAPVDVAVDSIAADALGARRTSQLALNAARHGRVTSALVGDDEIIHARQLLWDRYRLAVEHGTATALAALLRVEVPGRPEPAPARQPAAARSYRPAPGERVAVILCGANTDPSDLTGK